VLVVGPEVVQWVAARTNEFGSFGAAVGIGWARNGELLAGVAYNEFNGANINAHIASSGRHWLTRDFLWAIFDYPFRQLGVQRITGLVGEGNAAARRFDEHLGFTLETKLTGAHPTGDLLVYVMWKHDCRWLEKNHAQ